jgi:chromosome partitioning protein
MVFSTLIHRNTRLGEAPSFGKPAILYDPDSNGAVNYLNLAREILQKHDATKITQQDKILAIDNESPAE